MAASPEPANAQGTFRATLLLVKWPETAGNRRQGRRHAHGNAASLPGLSLRYAQTADRLLYIPAGLCKRLQSVCCRARGGIGMQARGQHGLPSIACPMPVLFIEAQPERAGPTVCYQLGQAPSGANRFFFLCLPACAARLALVALTEPGFFCRRTLVSAMSTQQGRLGQRLSAFKQKFSQLLGPKRHGYGELGQLEQPLVGHQAAADTDSAYMQQHGVPRPGSQAPASQGAAQYGQPVSGQQGQWQAPPGGAAPPASSNAVPDPVRDECLEHLWPALLQAGVL